MMKLSSPYREPIFVNALFVLNPRSPYFRDPRSLAVHADQIAIHVSRLETPNKCLNRVFDTCLPS